VSFYERACDYFLFDTKTPLPGGSGQKFDWSSLSAYRGTTPFLLSGGISPDDADRVEAFVHESCIGIDLNSRFETSPAYKDIRLLQSFIDKIKRK
jgi:phosphoribosylanthranilate isomerase